MLYAYQNKSILSRNISIFYIYLFNDRYTNDIPLDIWKLETMPVIMPADLDDYKPNALIRFPP